MAEHPSPSSDMPARSVLYKITETVDNFKLHSLPLLSLYEQWKSIQSSFAMAEASMESRAKKLETDERRIESMLSEIRVREEKLSEKAKKLGLREKEYNKRFKILEFNEKVVNDALDVKEKRIRELREALEVEKTGFIEELRVFEVRKRGIEEEIEVFESKKKGIVEGEKERRIEECFRDLEAREKEIEEEVEVFESKKKGIVEEFRDLEEKERKVEESFRDLEAREKEIEEEIEVFESKKKGMVKEFRDLEEKERRVEECFRDLESREKEIKEEIEVFESKKKGMEEEFRDLEERERRVEKIFRVLEAREKEIEERTRVEDLRAKEIVEERRVLEERRKAVDGTCQGLERREKELDERSKDMELREKELVELQRKLQLKEKDIDKGFKACCEELRLKKDELVESHRALGLKESEIVEKCKELELKQERMNEQLRVLELKENEITCRLNDKRVIHVNEDVDFTKTVEPNTMDFIDDNADHRQLSVAVKEKQVGVTDLKTVLIKKCTNLFKQTDDVEGKLTEDGCNVPGVKEVITENRQAQNLAVASVGASCLFAEIQSVFRNDDARATASYLADHSETVSMWQKNILDLREEITGLLESLIAEGKHLQAAMCTCVFKMKDVYPPEFLLNTHLEHVRERAEEIVKKASGTAEDDAANMELSALRNVLQCISDFKLESIYPPTPHELRITQLEKEMEVRTKPACDLGTKLEAPESTTQTKTISDSQPERKRKASPSSSVKQSKHHRGSDSDNRIPYYSHHPHFTTPYRNHVLRPTHFLTTNWPRYRYPTPGVIYDIPYDIGSGSSSGRLNPRRYPGGFQTRPHYF